MSVCEGVNRTVELCACSEGVFARPISIGVACSPVRAPDVSAGNVLTCVCVYVRIIYACIVYFMYPCMHMVYCMYVRMYVHSLYFMCIKLKYIYKTLKTIY